jgi:hypothetical protein
MKNQFCNCLTLKDIVIVWVLVLTPISIITSAAKAGRAFYEQVILNNWRPYKLRVTPDMFRPSEGFDLSRTYCSARKAIVPKLPKVETV